MRTYFDRLKNIGASLLLLGAIIVIVFGAFPKLRLEAQALTDAISLRTTGKLLFGDQTPTVVASSGFGTGAAVTQSNGTTSFTVNVGTSPTTLGIVQMNQTATNGWNCRAEANTPGSYTKLSTSFTTGVQVINYGASSSNPLAWANNAILQFTCAAQ